MTNTLKPPLDPKRISKIRLLLTDVDGVLTDGRVYVTESGETIKSTHIRDGMGFRLWLDSGRIAGIVSAARAPGIAIRFSRIGVQEFFDQVSDKGIVCRNLMQKYQLTQQEVLFIGDDLADLPAFAEVGLRIAPPDAVSEVLAQADWITHTPGGLGVIREVVDEILKTSR